MEVLCACDVRCEEVAGLILPGGPVLYPSSAAGIADLFRHVTARAEDNHLISNSITLNLHQSQHIVRLVR